MEELIGALADLATVLLVVASMRWFFLWGYSRLTFLLLRSHHLADWTWWMIGPFVVASVPLILSVQIGEEQRVLAARFTVSTVFLISAALVSQLEFREQGIFGHGRFVLWSRVRRAELRRLDGRSQCEIKLFSQWMFPMRFRISDQLHSTASKIVRSSVRQEKMPFPAFAFGQLMQVILILVATLVTGIVWNVCIGDRKWSLQLLDYLLQ